MAISFKRCPPWNRYLAWLSKINHYGRARERQ